MIVITKYICDICKKEYGAELDALACENSHPSTSCDCGIVWRYCESDVRVMGGFAHVNCISCNRVAPAEGSMI